MRLIPVLLSCLIAGLFSSAANATLLGRDLDGNASTAEAFFDTVLNITWLGDANYARTSGYDADGYMNWMAANAWAAQLDINGYDAWRLPAINPINGVSFTTQFGNLYDGTSDYGFNITSPQSEMAHLFHVTLGNPDRWTTLGVNSGCFISGVADCLDIVGPFSNLRPSIYWSSREYNVDPMYARYFMFEEGAQGLTLKTYELASAWAVSDGDIGRAVTPAQVPEPGSLALLLAGGLVWRFRTLRSKD
jgi:hypothetical protein